MKKRSLFAAVAMLIVSAIVLTSATYAWFQASTAASMASFTASISKESTGAITISADNSEFKTSLSQADYYQNGDTTGTLKTACQGCRFPTTLTAVSFSPATQANPQVAGAYDGTEFKPASVPTTGAYVVYTIYVKADASCTVNATLTSTQTTAPFIWAAIKQSNSNYATVNANQQGETGHEVARSYTPITAYTAVSGSTVNPLDGNANYVVDSTEATGSTCTLGSTVTSTSNAGATATIQLTFSGAEIIPITVYEWCEGQDLACNGTINGSSTISVAFEVQQQSNGGGNG